MTPTGWLRLEGLAMFIGAAAVYARLGLNGWVFAVLLFSLDVTMIGYLRDTRLGALIYNLGHNYVLPLILFGVAYMADWSPGIGFGLIWIAHISLDRTLGYGLKYPTAFKDTHLGKL